MKKFGRWESALLIAPGVALVLGCLVIPLCGIMALSVTEPRTGLENYAALFTDPDLQAIILTTLRICALAALISTGLGYLLAYSLVHTGPRLKKLMFFLMLVPLWVSALIRAFAWLLILRSGGIANSTLQWAGIIGSPLQLAYNTFAVLVGMVHYMLPFAVLPLYANMSAIDRQLVRAARGLGAGQSMAFRRVFLPLSVSGIFAALSLTFIMSLGFYITPLLLSGGRLTMMADFISVLIFDINNWGRAAALAMFLLAMVLTIYGATNSLFKNAQPRGRL